MMTIFLTFIVLGIALIIMAIGVIFSNKELKGSCGGKDLDCTCSTIQQKLCKIKINHSNYS
tara:strand:+ start:385 stop:567 length:183 start_codon:yes stop_codon:yes gene_type:complete